MKQAPATITNLSGDDSPALMSVTAKGRLEGLLLSMTVSQVFKNNTKSNMEVVYTFPVAWGAVLLGLDATLGGQRRSGQVMAKQTATQNYEAAIEKGDAPIMVEKNKGGTYTASLGSLKPGEEAVLDIRYAQLLSLDHGQVRLTIPTTIGPRFGDAMSQGGLRFDQVPGSNLFAEYPFGVSIDITCAMAQARIGSPSHPVTQQSTPEGVCVSLARSAMLDRDFVLLLEDLPVTSWALTGPDRRSGKGHHATLLSHCPNLVSTDVPSLSVKILVDCSGSMSGDRIEQARSALAGLTQLLDERDRFSLTLFGSEYEHIVKPVTADRMGLKQLDIALKTMTADYGGTEMRSAAQATFEIAFPALADNTEADVLLITDGDIWEAQALVDAAKASGHRVYALGVGSAPNESMLAEMAVATGGACELVGEGEDMAQAIQRMVQRMRLALPVKAEWQVPGDSLWSSPIPKRIASGETVHLFVRTPQALSEAPVLALDGQGAARPALQVTQDDVLARLLAATQVGLTQDVETAQALAEKYELVTEHTNLLLVIERADADKTDGLPQLHQVVHMTPAGHSGTGRMRFGIDRQMSKSMRIPDVQQINMSMSGPALYRSPIRRTGSDNVPFQTGCMEDFELPAFLRKQGVEILKPSQLLARAIIRTFHDALDDGHEYRQAIRIVANASFDVTLESAIEAAKKVVKTPLKAWSCLLMWASNTAGYTHGFTDHSLILVMRQLSVLSESDQAKANEVIEQLLATQDICGLIKS
jgi:Ca-activated chloride channel family protein